MEYRQLGNAGVRVSVVGLGANRFGSADVPQPVVDKIINAALDAGVNLIDTANGYNDGLIFPERPAPIAGVHRAIK